MSCARMSMRSGRGSLLRLMRDRAWLRRFFLGLRRFLIRFRGWGRQPDGCHLHKVLLYFFKRPEMRQDRQGDDMDNNGNDNNAHQKRIALSSASHGSLCPYSLSVAMAKCVTPARRAASMALTTVPCSTFLSALRMI